MNRNRWLGCLVAAFAVTACGLPPEEERSSSSAAVQAGADHSRGMLVCDAQIPLPLDVMSQIGEVEVHRVYKTQRPGFIREWVPIGFRENWELWNSIYDEFDSVADAQAFNDWLENGFNLDGRNYWGGPEFRLGHECHVWEVLASEDRPSNPDNEVSVRIERIQTVGIGAREAYRASFDQVRRASQRAGNSSVMMLYSAEQSQISLVYFRPVERSQRSLGNPVPISAEPPLVPGASFDWSAWVGVIFFPFAPGDHGRPAIWTLPGIEPWRGDGVCEVSRHESVHNTTDCLATCGNAVQDPGETPFNCPGDVPM